jgi:hypothetical protein
MNRGNEMPKKAYEFTVDKYVNVKKVNAVARRYLPMPDLKYKPKRLEEHPTHRLEGPTEMKPDWNQYQFIRFEIVPPEYTLEKRKLWDVAVFHTKVACKWYKRLNPKVHPAEAPARKFRISGKGVTKKMIIEVKKALEGR